jgi:TetR/AcrR family transcriptional regulator
MTATQQNKPRAGRPTNANPELQREKIIRAALAQFSQRGFAGTSVRTIAQQAGITHGLIRHYFQCKEELFHSAADYLFGEMAQVLAQAAEQSSPDDPVGQLVLQIRSFVRLSAQLPHMAGFLMQAGLDGGDHFHYVIEKHVRPLQELSLIAYRRAVAEGLMHNINPNFVFLIATHAATAPFANPALRHVLGDASASNLDLVEDYADTLINILLDGALTEKYRAESR